MMAPHSWLRLALVCAACGLFSAPALAGIVTVNFSGTVGIVLGAGAQAVFESGDTFAGSFSYESTTPDSSAITTLGQYGAGMVRFSISFADGNGTYYSGSQTNGFLGNALEVSDGASFDSFRAAGTPAPNPPGLTSGRLQINFADSDGSTFSSDALPEAPDLNALSAWSGTWQLPSFLSVANLLVTNTSVLSADGPVWNSIEVTPDGEVTLELQTEEQAQYQIDRSLDLDDWTFWQTITADGPTYELNDTIPADEDSRFYRATRL